jgi:flagellar FliJ protein
MHSQRMKPLQEAAKSREDDAVTRFVERQRELARHESRLTELRAYVQDYSKVKGDTHFGHLLQIRRDFVDRLREIVRIEEQEVERARLACDTERAHWLAAHRSTSVLDKLTEQYRAEESRAENRRSQKESDELAAQIWRRGHGSNP